MTLPQHIDLTIDWHCHLLPGLDDGPATLDESFAMAHALSQGGVKVVHCTPHFIKGSYEHSPDQVRAAITKLQEELSQGGIQLELRPGMEYMLDEFFSEQLTNPLPLGDTNLLLVEAYPSLPFEQLKETIFEIVRSGLTPLLAHPERNALLASPATQPGLLSRLTGKKGGREEVSLCVTELASLGCRFQGNLGSLTGYYGRHVQSQALIFASENIYDLYGSDAHSLAQCHNMLTP